MMLKKLGKTATTELFHMKINELCLKMQNGLRTRSIDAHIRAQNSPSDITDCM